MRFLWIREDGIGLRARKSLSRSGFQLFENLTGSLPARFFLCGLSHLRSKSQLALENSHLRSKNASQKPQNLLAAFVAHFKLQR
jgi:hypothetical protein